MSDAPVTSPVGRGRRASSSRAATRPNGMSPGPWRQRSGSDHDPGACQRVVVAGAALPRGAEREVAADVADPAVPACQQALDGDADRRAVVDAEPRRGQRLAAANQLHVRHLRQQCDRVAARHRRRHQDDACGARGSKASHLCELALGILAGDAQHQLEAASDAALRDGLGDRRVEVVAHVGYDEPDHRAASAAHQLRRCVRNVAEALRSGTHPCLGLLTDVRVVRQRARHGGGRHPELLGDVLDGDHAHWFGGRLQTIADSPPPSPPWLGKSSALTPSPTDANVCRNLARVEPDARRRPRCSQRRSAR